MVPELNIRDNFELIDDWACVSRTPLKNACGVPREMILRWFSNNWKWKDSHFHRGRVSKRFRMQAGPSTGSMERGKEARILRWDFADRLHNVRWIFCGSVNTNLSIHLFHIGSIAGSQRSIIHNRDFIVRSTSTRWSVNPFEDGPHWDSLRPESTINYSNHQNCVALTVKSVCAL